MSQHFKLPTLASGLVLLSGLTLMKAALPQAFALPQASEQPGLQRVSTSTELRAALRSATPGARIELAPGEYSGGNWITNTRGVRMRPIVIAAADPKQRPIIKGGKVGIQFSGAEYLELHDLDFRNFEGNALMIDDAGVRDKPAHHIVLKNLHFSDVTPPGTWHAIKMAGVDDFVLENCRFERWGGGESGIAVDGVGCHRGLVTGNIFKGRNIPGNRSYGAIQFKGGSRDILIRSNRFENTGARDINIGGHTGDPYFRPPLDSWPAGEAKYEAKDITVEGNTFIGTDAPVAYVSADGAVVRFNTIYRPGRWAFRILQEKTGEGFAPSRNGVFSDNIVVFRRGNWISGGVNVGAKTAPETFRFARNLWFCEDDPSRSKPSLPVAEVDGMTGIDPQFVDAANGDLRVAVNSPARQIGAHAVPPIEPLEHKETASGS